ncbi:Mth938-like domain-containing protein [Rhodalgimonas zhirmunskyi]|uniref:Mth938-like domain-containing protein n=1 Tax=Rhodalgimonas zhirmunskyi TaxID=2964767 RepID=A0AAJ1UCB5_9RHOB|nr:Mth938-like domain-containing protein [Rhodoalgimonas zhirmunskyi]MDQ2093297.1 Mth938-like domain-containing protein [Rhodoalgimonas zhirmunskyi]
MRFAEVDFGDIQPVDGYGPGFFRIGGKIYEGAILLTEAGVKPWGGYDDRAALLDLAGEVDVLLIGTGADIAHIPADLRQQIENTGIGAESMTSPAACRSWNVLAAEGRRVALAALAV